MPSCMDAVRGPSARNTTPNPAPYNTGYFFASSGRNATAKRIIFGNLEGALRRGRGGKEKEWTDRVQSDIRAFGIAGDWKATALKAKVWVETVTEGGRRFIAAWRKEGGDAARHRQEKREATRLGNWLYRRRESVEFCEARPIGLVPSRRAEDILVGTRDRPRPA